MDQQQELTREDFRQVSQHLGRTAAHTRHENERLARQLAKEALQQWQRSIEGVLALPTASALVIASTTLYLAAFIERGFEVVQQSTEALRTGVEQGRRERERMEGEEERGGDRARARGGERMEVRGEA